MKLKMQRVNQKQLDLEVLPEEARKELIDRRMKGKENGKIDAVHEFHKNIINAIDEDLLLFKLCQK